nr:hypothetical protein [Tanacetum cinerariifolium]
MLVSQGEGLEHPSEPHHTPSAQDESIHHEQITQSVQHAPITSPEPIPRSYEQTTSQEPISKVPSPGVDETAFPSGYFRYKEAFPTNTSLDAGQDRENIAKTSAMPHEALPRVTSLGGEEKIRTCSRGCSKHKGMDQGEDLLVGDTMKDSDNSADKRSDSKDEMSHILGSLRAANILASGGLRLVFTTASPSVATASIDISSVVATASGSFPIAAIFTTASVTTPTSRDKGKGKLTEPKQPSKEEVLEQMSIKLARDLEAKFAQEDLIIREQAERDSEIARIHADRELEVMIA